RAAAEDDANADADHASEIEDGPERYAGADEDDEEDVDATAVDAKKAVEAECADDAAADETAALTTLRPQRRPRIPVAPLGAWVVLRVESAASIQSANTR